MTLSEYKERHSLTYQQLADLIGIEGKNSARTVQRYALGERSPSLRIMSVIAQITDGQVTFSDFAPAIHKGELA